MKKVCHISTVHSALDTRIFHKECATLAKAGYAVTLIAQHSKNQVLNGVKIISVQTPRDRFRRLFNLPPSVTKLALKESADLYHFHDPELIPIGLLFRAIGKKVVYDVHEDYQLAILLREWIPRRLRALLSTIYRALESFASRCMTGIIAADAPTASKFRHCPNVVVLYNFPLPELSESLHLDAAESNHNSDKTIVYVGTISEGHGIHILLEALKLVVKEYKMDVTLLLIGKCHSRRFERYIKRFITEASLTRYVKLSGPVEYRTIPDHLASARIGLAALQAQQKYFVNIPTKIFEYMACGLPIIASDLPPIRQFLGDHDMRCGLLVEAGNPVAFAKAIKRLLDDKKFAYNLGRNGLRLFKMKYNWRTEGKKILDFYNNLLGNCLG